MKDNKETGQKGMGRLGIKQVRAKTVEIAKPEHLSSVCKIDELVIGNESRRGYLEQMVQEKRCFIWTSEGELYGYAVLEQTFYGNAFLSLLIVHPDARQQGVGSDLLLFVEPHSPTEKLFTSTNESNVKMQKLLEKSRYVKSGWIDNLDEGDPEIVYFKRLNAHA